MNDHLSTLRLDALALKDSPGLSADDRARAEAHLGSCAQCRGLAEEMQAGREKFNRDVYMRTLPAVEARVHRWQIWRIAWTLVPATAVTALALMISVRKLPVTFHSDEFATKGGPTLQVYAKRGDKVFEVHEGDRLLPGDQLRFVVDPGDLGEVMIASIDGEGHASVYYPFDGAHSVEVARGRTELAGSVVLDQAVGDERLFAIFSKEPVEADEVRKALSGSKGAEPLDLRQPAAVQLSLRFHKSAP